MKIFQNLIIAIIISSFTVQSQLLNSKKRKKYGYKGNKIEVFSKWTKPRWSITELVKLTEYQVVSIWE